MKRRRQNQNHCPITKFELDTTKFRVDLIRNLSNGRRREKKIRGSTRHNKNVASPIKWNRDELFWSIRKIYISTSSKQFPDWHVCKVLVDARCVSQHIEKLLVKLIGDGRTDGRATIWPNSRTFPSPSFFINCESKTRRESISGHVPG